MKKLWRGGEDGYQQVDMICAACYNAENSSMGSTLACLATGRIDNVKLSTEEVLEFTTYDNLPDMAEACSTMSDLYFCSNPEDEAHGAEAMVRTAVQ